MYPFGIALRKLGYSLNVYGRLTADAISRWAGVHPAPRWALQVQHFVIGWAFAVPLALLLARRRILSRVAGMSSLVGASYGALVWLVVNSLALPFVFGRPTPWTLGGEAIWPSLLVHVVYGVTTSAVAVATLPLSPSPGSARPSDPTIPSP